MEREKRRVGATIEWNVDECDNLTLELLEILERRLEELRGFGGVGAFSIWSLYL